MSMVGRQRSMQHLALRRLLSSQPASQQSMSMREIVLTRRRAAGVAIHDAHQRRRQQERKSFGATTFELLLGGGLAVGAYAYAASNSLDAPGLLAPRPKHGRPLPPRVQLIVHGSAGGGSTAGGVSVYGRRWARVDVKCAMCRRSLLRRGEPCFLHSEPGEAGQGQEVLLCAQHYATAHCQNCALCAVRFEPAGELPLLLPTGEAFCQSCTTRPCYSCARPIGRADAAARPLCGTCRASAVVSERAALELLRELKGWFLDIGLDFGRWEPGQLRLVSSVASAHLEGLTHRSSLGRGGAGPARTVPAIDLLHGLPRHHAAQVLAHEMAHAWLWLQHFPEPLDKKTEEGVCELFAYLWLLCEEAAQEAAAPAGADALTPSRRQLLQRIRVMELRGDHAYGDGFREALAASERHGLALTLASVRTTGRLPGVARPRPGGW
ncbi:hypothetical protein T492DRAFT_958753 [Pavlovales sp. CCMP2436]|nr:hypothetical protein T492DRAFT_958753 [Pavlovales sp. CCMP2436]